VCILYYHLVANRPLNHMCLPLEQFVAQMEILRRHCRLVSVDEAAARRPGPDADEVTVAVTFDDGYRDNTWAVEYMRCFGVPAAFFVSIGHVRDGRPFDHDVRRGFTEALPIDVAGVRKLAADGFVVGSHGLYHEDLGALDPREAERVMAESRRLIAEATGASPEHFSFPKGQRGTNITAESFAAATRHYGYVHSAYGGYNFPDPQVRHLRRMGNPIHVFDLVPLLDGYTGLRECLTGNAWGLETAALAPYATPARRGGLGALRFGGVSFRSSR
jgi:peptidoglycan/xylan/chitin deacetylase (PgdA/CDA1 family)